MSFIGKLKIGTQVLVSNGQKFTDKKAVVKYIGKIQGKPDQFIGVQLETPDGTHSGTFEGKEYFKAKQNHGMFAKPKAVKLSDGSLLSTLLTTTKPIPKQKQPKQKQPIAKTMPLKTQKVAVVAKKPVAQNKLSSQLKQAQNSLQLQKLREQLQQSLKRIQILQSTDSQKQLNAYRSHIRELQDENRMLLLEQQKLKVNNISSNEQKTKQLQQKIDFFNNQKTSQQKQKSQLKKKIQKLQQQLQISQGNLQQFQKLTFKYQALQSKNVKLKQQLESTKTQLRNQTILGSNKPSTTQSNQQFQENIKILNQTVSLMEGQLNQEKEKTLALELQLDTLKNKTGDVTKLEKKLKSRDEELEALKAELEASADAATFAEKLTLNLLKKDQQLKDATIKLTQYLKKIQNLEIEISQAKEMIQLQTLQLQTQQDQVQKKIQQKTQQANYIAQLNKQISKYKTKISQLSQNNESLLNQSLLQNQEQGTPSGQIFLSDPYQQKYFQCLKTIQSLQQKYLSQQLQQSSIKNLVGLQMLNLIDIVPEAYLGQFYPDVIRVLVEVKTAQDKLYMLFQATNNVFRNKHDIYNRDNAELAHWVVMLMEQIPLLYGQLRKIQMALLSAQDQEEISDILSNTVLREIVRKVDIFCTQLLHRFALDNLDASTDLDPLIEPVQSLDKICADCRKLQYQLQTRSKLCVQTMLTIQKIFSIVLTFKQQSQLGESAQVDTMLQVFLKSLIAYLEECCKNPQLRIRNQTKQYLVGIDCIVNVLEEIQINQSVAELASLYSQTQFIKMLKQTILTTQFHLKQLINDLTQIFYTNPLAKIKSVLPGKVWQQRAKKINTQLGRVQQLLCQKQQLQTNLTQSKRKVLVLQKQIKDRQSTKQLYQKRMGQLQLKLQQSSSLQSQTKRYIQKIKSIQQSNKLLQDQIQLQVNKRRQVEDQNKKIKQQLELVKMESGKGKVVRKDMQQGDTASMVIFKNVINQCNTLRTIDLKKKILIIKQSPLIAKLNPQNTQTNIPNTIRRKVLDSFCQLKINDPRKKMQPQQTNILQKLETQANQFYFNKSIAVKKQITELKIGNFILKNPQITRNLKVHVQTGEYKIMSY